MRIIIAIVLFMLSTMVACSPQLLMPLSSDADRAQQRYPGIDSVALAQGRNFYILKCSSCHQLYKPEKFTLQQWENLFPEMEVEAKLTPAESESISRYLNVMCQAKR